MARISKSEKLRRVNQIRQTLSRGGTRSECLELAATEWGLKPRSADFYIHEATQQILENFFCGFAGDCAMKWLVWAPYSQVAGHLSVGLIASMLDFICYPSSRSCQFLTAV